MAITGKGAEGIDLAASAMAAEMSARLRNRRASSSTTSSSSVEEPELPPAPRDP